MPNSQRAKQFAPFDAVVGLRAALKEKEKIKVPKKVISDDMAEEIDRTLKSLHTGDIITVVYYDEIGEEYLQITGRITAIDYCKKIIKIESRPIDFNEIYSIVK